MPARHLTAPARALAVLTLLAALNGPLALYVIWRALRGEFALHRRWARILVPVWLYVALSGWVIYLVLKRYGVERGGIAF